MLKQSFLSLSLICFFYGLTVEAAPSVKPRKGLDMTVSVTVPDTGSQLTFNESFWKKVEPANQELEKVLSKEDYSAILRGEQNWYRIKQQYGKRLEEESYRSGGIVTEKQLLDQLQLILKNPTNLALYSYPHFLPEDKTGTQYRESLTDCSEIVQYADASVAVTQPRSQAPYYTFWDTRTCRPLSKLYAPCFAAEIKRAEDSFTFIPWDFCGSWLQCNDSGRDDGILAINLAKRQVSWRATDLENYRAMGMPYDANNYDDAVVLRKLDADMTKKGGIEYLGKWVRYFAYNKVASEVFSESRLPVACPAYWWGGKSSSDENTVASVSADGEVLLYHLDSFTVERRSAGTDVRFDPFDYTTKEGIKNDSWVVKPPSWVLEDYVDKDTPAVLKKILPMFNSLPMNKEGNFEESRSYAAESSAGSRLISYPSTNEDINGEWHYAVYVYHQGELFGLSRFSDNFSFNKSVMKEQGSLIPLKTISKATNGERNQWNGWVWEHLQLCDNEPLLAIWEDDSAVLGVFSHNSIVYLVKIDFEHGNYTICKSWSYAPDMRPLWLKGKKWLLLPQNEHEYAVIHVNGAEKQDEVARFFVSPGRAFALVLPDGRFGGSAGCEKLLRWSDGSSTIDMDALSLWRNRPGEVLEALGGNPDDIAALKETTRRWLQKQGYDTDSLPPEPALADFPRVMVSLPPLRTKQRNINVDVQVTATKRNVPTLEVRINGVLQQNAAHCSVSAGTSASVTCSLELGVGQNWVEVTPIDSEGIRGQTEKFRTICDVVHSADLFVVAMGVSAYRDASLSLRYAAKDATDLVKGFEKYGAGKVRTLLLTDDEVKSHGTLERIQGFLSAATVDDSVVLYCAGHGLLDDKLNYYYAPSDVDVDNPAATGLSMEQLNEALASTNARRRLLILDTCHSGLLGEADEEKLAMIQSHLPHGVRAVQNRGMKVKQIPSLSNTTQKKRYIEEMFSRTGVQRGLNVLAGSAGAEYALESEEWNNGVFTAGILEGLQSHANCDLSGDGQVSVGELMRWLTASVTKNTGGAQKPDMSPEYADDFMLTATPVYAINHADWPLLQDMLARGLKVEDDVLPTGRSAISLALDRYIDVELLPELVKAGADVMRPLADPCQEASIGIYGISDSNLRDNYACGLWYAALGYDFHQICRILYGENAGSTVNEKSSSSSPNDPYAGWSAAQLRQEGGRLSDAGQQEQAMQLIRRAADAGDSTAQRWLGWRYIQGRGVGKDKNMAAYWFNRAADQGDSSAVEALRTNGLQRTGAAASSVSSYVPSDPYAGWSAAQLRQEGGRLSDAGKQTEALQLIKRAANAGDSTAQRWLGFRYLNGRGVAKDKNQAKYWFGKAAAQGDSGAAQALKDMR